MGTEATVTQADFDRAAKETERLQSELDVTNADHIALWIEANLIPDEPMSQCVSWFACRIAEAHERAVSEQRKAFGYAAGNYSIICINCRNEVEGCAKLSIRCAACADEARTAASQASDAGGKLPQAAPGHWDTPEGREIAVDYLAKDRANLCMGDVSDFHLANKQFLEDISVGTVTFQSAIGMQTAAKERIRWLSVHLAAANQKLATLTAPPTSIEPVQKVHELTSGEEMRLRALLQEFVEAMERYQMDVDGDAPYRHRDMMERARAALTEGAQ